MNIQYVYVIAAQHGDELFGLKVLAHLEALGLPNIKLKIGHPEAIAKKRRFIDRDLNRSFGDSTYDGREFNIAQRITSEILECNPDIILDLHTSRGNVGKVAIAASTSPILQTIAAHLGMEHFVTMPRSIAKVSLIGQFPERAMSLEFGAGQRSDRLAQDVANAIARLQDQTLHKSSTKIAHYIVERMIENHEAKDQSLVNYQFNPALNGYPFLVGKNTYSEFRGFLAHRADDTK